jgi:hypothetical protein
MRCGRATERCCSRRGCRTAARAIEGLDLGDAVQWGGAERVAPGKEPGFGGDTTGPYLAGIGAAVAYALASADGGELAAASDGASSSVTFVPHVALPPGASVEYQRVLAIAPRGDTIGVATELLVLAGGAPGGVALELVDARGAALPPLAGKATFAPLGTSTPHAPGELALWLRAAGDGPLGAEVPPGRYLVSFEGSGRRALEGVRVEVRPGEIAAVKLTVSDAADGGALDR